MAEFKDEKGMGVSSVMVHFIRGHSPQSGECDGGDTLPITSRQQETVESLACRSWMPGEHSLACLGSTAKDSL